MSNTTSATTTQNFQISVPSNDIGTDKNVVFKIQPTTKKEEKVQKFRSFNMAYVMCNQGALNVAGKCISCRLLYDLLVENGMSKTVPCKSNSYGEFIEFDWNPPNYNGPTVWEFTWKLIPCSLTAFGNNTLTFRIYDMTPGVGEKVMQEISDELLKRYKDPTPLKTLNIYTAQKTMTGFAWTTFASRLHRPMETIYIDAAIKNDLVQQLTTFYDSAAFYDRHGVTHKRVLLFHGPPGVGKSSFVVALASILGKDICKMTIGNDMDSRQVENLLHASPQNSFVLIEDVDALFVNREGTGLLDFSTLLQCTDGITTKRGLVLFMTTNHIDKLDEAFLRPGRVDCAVEFNLPGLPQLRLALETLAPQFKHEHDAYLEKNGTITIAALQKHLFDCIMGKKNTIL